AARVASSGRRTQVGEVADRFESVVELGVGEASLQCGVVGEKRAPIGIAGAAADDVVCDRTERVNDVGIEVRASSGAGNFDGGVCSSAALEDLDNVAQVEQPHRHCDVIAADTAW